MGRQEEELKQVVQRVAAGVAALVAVVMVISSCTVVKPGDAGVLFNRVTGSLATTGQGVIFKAPFVTTIQEYPIALRTYTMVAKSGEGSSSEDDSIDLPTAEGQHIRQDLSVTYNTSSERAADVFRSFKGANIEDIERTFIRRTIITVAQNASGQMPLSDLISAKRGVLQDAVQKALSVELGKMGFTLDKVNLGASHLPKSIEEQLQTKMSAQQNAQKAEYELQREVTMAKAVVAKAHGEADAALISAEAKAKSNNLLRSSLTKELIRMRAIDRWDGALPKISGGATASVVNIKDLFEDKE